MNYFAALSGTDADALKEEIAGQQEERRQAAAAASSRSNGGAANGQQRGGSNRDGGTGESGMKQPLVWIDLGEAPAAERNVCGALGPGIASQARLKPAAPQVLIPLLMPAAVACPCSAEMTGLDVESDSIMQIAVICTGVLPLLLLVELLLQQGPNGHACRHALCPSHTPLLTWIDWSLLSARCRRQP
jgi:hypothetical protein